MPNPLRPTLIEFPADDPNRARRFWEGLLGRPLAMRPDGEGSGWEAGGEPAIGVHARGAGPGDRFSLPYFSVDDIAQAQASVTELGGEIVHAGERWTICRDSEGTPFALAADPS